MTIIYGILGLGFLVFFHETGHFLAARLMGVKVETFSIGMGPVLLKHKWGETEYRISLIPLGGYCGMKGEKDYQKALEQNLPTIEGSKDSFYGVHPFRRLLIAFAGPAANYILAVIAFSIIAMMGYTYYSPSCKVFMADEVYEDIDSPAHMAGMQSGDIILFIDNKPMNDFTDISQYVSLNPDKDSLITVDRNGNQLEIPVHITLDKDTGSGKLGIVADNTTYNEHTVPSLPFFKALAEGFAQAAKMTSASLKSIFILFKGIKITNAMAGPAHITTLIGDTVQQGFSESINIGIISTLQLIALISISLFITNLLPVPVLDGGLILFALAEIVTRKKMKPKFLYYIQFVGVAFIAFMLILAITSDLHYFIGR